MIIDDDEDDREFFCYAVKMVYPNIEIIQASDGEEGLKLLREMPAQPECVFVDLNMPRVDGVHFLKCIKAIDCLKDIPVIIYTTSKLKHDKDITLALGASYFLTKPDNLAEMRKEISFILERGWQHIYLH
jgi:CheY-like chemotaxis protein